MKFEISLKMRRPRQAALALAFTIALVASARSDEPWIKLPTAPYTLNNKQDAIAFADALTGWYGNGTGRIYRTDDGGEAWVWQGQTLPNVGFNAVVGRPSTEYGFEPTRFDEMRRGAWDVNARVAELRASR